MRFAQIQEDALVLWPSLPTCITTPDGIVRDNLAHLSEQELNALGIYCYEPSPPPYDPMTQWLVGPIVSFDGEKVVATYRILDKTAEEIASELAQIKADKAAELAAARYEQEIGGVPVPVGGTVVTIKTDRESQAMITGAAFSAAQDSAYWCRWKAIEGFVHVTADQILSVATIVRNHIQASFDREAELLDQVQAATTRADVEAISW